MCVMWPPLSATFFFSYRVKKKRAFSYNEADTREGEAEASSKHEEHVDLSILEKGCTVTKAGRDGNISEKVIRLSTDHRFIVWESKFLFVKKVDLTDVVSIVHGQETDNFKPHVSELGFAKENSFSLICVDRTYDFIVPNRSDFKNWYYGLKQIITHKYNAET